MSDFFSSKAYPASGFWLEMLGSIGLAVSGGALATLTEEQLARIARLEPPERRVRRRPAPARQGEGVSAAAREVEASSPARSHVSAHRRERELAARRAERRRRGA